MSNTTRQISVKYTLESIYPSVQMKNYLERIWKTTSATPEQTTDYEVEASKKPERKKRQKLLRSFFRKVK